MVRRLGLLAVMAAALGASAGGVNGIQGLQKVRMFADRTGWGWSEPDRGQRGMGVWHVEDRGAGWKQVRTLGPDALVEDFVALDGNVARVALLQDESPTVTFLRTENGGATWRQTAVAVKGMSQVMRVSLSFVDKDRGWMLVEPEHAMNSSYGVLFATRDGGTHWNEVSRGGSVGDQRAAGRTLPFGGKIEFVDQKTGWVVGYDTSTGGAGMEVTRDGGKTWDVVGLAKPAGMKRWYTVVQGVPVFEGGWWIVKADLRNSDADWRWVVRYRTKDGRTWVLEGMERMEE